MTSDNQHLRKEFLSISLPPSRHLLKSVTVARAHLGPARILGVGAGGGGDGDGGGGGDGGVAGSGPVGPF